jgi:DNA-binding NarL/FixJ family response regulator
MNLDLLATVFATDPRLPGRATDPGPAEEEKTSRRVRVVLVDDHRIVLDGLAGLLSQDRRVKIVGKATNGREAVQVVREELPDAVLMDVVMPEIGGIEATRMIKAEFPQIAVVGLSMLADEHTRQAMLRAGACAHLGKDADLSVLLATLFGCVQ